MGKAAVLLLLLVNAAGDIRRREISLSFTMGFLTVGAACRLLCLKAGSWLLPGLLLPLMPGFSLLLLSWFSSGKIGAGDGLVVLAAGFWTEAEPLLYACLGAFLLVVLAEALLRLFRRSRKEWPFMPFLCAAWVFYEWVFPGRIV